MCVCVCVWLGSLTFERVFVLVFCYCLFFIERDAERIDIAMPLILMKRQKHEIEFKRFFKKLGRKISVKRDE